MTPGTCSKRPCRNIYGTCINAAANLYMAAKDPKMFICGTLFKCRSGTRSFPSAQGNEVCGQRRPKARRLSRPVIRSGLRVSGALPAPRDGKDLSGTRQMKRVPESNIFVAPANERLHDEQICVPTRLATASEQEGHISALYKKYAYVPRYSPPSRVSSAGFH